MKEIFIDTSAWIAVVDVSDQYHRVAAGPYHRLFRSYGRLVTTDLVVSESHNLLRRTLSSTIALQWLVSILGSPRIDVVFGDRTLLDKGRAWLRRYPDQEFSLTDAVSFALMQDRSIHEAFAFDEHFRTAGFELLP